MEENINFIAHSSLATGAYGGFLECLMKNHAKNVKAKRRTVTAKLAFTLTRIPSRTRKQENLHHQVKLFRSRYRISLPGILLAVISDHLSLDTRVL
jgi:hypothetical protein